MLFPDLYINEYIDTTTLHTKQDILNYLASNGYIVHDGIQLSNFNTHIKKVKYSDIDIPENAYDYKINSLRYENDTYIADLEYMIDNRHTSRIAENNLNTRNKLLQSTDWIETSTVVSGETILAYRYYRQLLRDIFTVLDINQPIVFPKPPKIQFTYLAITSSTYSAEAITYIQNYINTNIHTAEWNLFLSEWLNLNQTLNKDVVKRLLNMYLTSNVEDILEELKVYE